MNQEYLPADAAEDNGTKQIEPASMVAPLELQAPGAKLDGSEGEYRVSNTLPRMIRADNDLEAINEWLSVQTKPGTPTWRAYRKEAERLLAWAIVERKKPVSSLDRIDMAAYPTFLAKPVSAVGVSWTAHYRYCEEDDTWVPVATDADGKAIKTRFKRTDDRWRPFDGPLSPASVDYALRVLKGFFGYLNEVGYLQLSPMSGRLRKTVVEEDRKEIVAQRSFDIDTWQFIYDFAERQRDAIPAELDKKPKDRLNWIRTWNRNMMVLAALYLLGLRISELQGLRMNDFYSRQFKDPTSGKFVRSWWVQVLGKGNKKRHVPVPDQLVGFIREYRKSLNDFPHKSRIDANSAFGRGSLSEELGEDDSELIRNLSGNKAISTNRLQVSVKDIMQGAIAEYHRLKDLGMAPADIDTNKIKRASAHWFRHTSATHQGYGGIEDGQLQINLGHASIDTTRIYKHEDPALRAKATKGFSIRPSDSAE